MLNYCSDKLIVTVLCGLLQSVRLVYGHFAFLGSVIGLGASTIGIIHAGVKGNMLHFALESFEGQSLAWRKHARQTVPSQLATSWM